MEGFGGKIWVVVNGWVDVIITRGFVLILIEGIFDVWKCEFWTVLWVWLEEWDVESDFIHICINIMIILY